MGGTDTVRRDLMDILVCPICRSALELAVGQEESDEVIAGTLTCTACGQRYPIEDSIPNLLPPELPRSSS